MKKTKILTRHKIISLLQNHKDALREYKVARIGLFGSYAAGVQRRNSDIDFLVEFKEPTFDNFIKLADYLEKLLGRKIDILTPKGLEGIRVKGVAETIKKSVLYA